MGKIHCVLLLTQTKTESSWNRDGQRLKSSGEGDTCTDTHTGMHTHTHRWEIKCWTGDREQNRHFLSPFSFEFTWREEVREVKQILPSLCEVPLRGVGVHVGGTMLTPLWQLLTPLTSSLEQTTILDPHMGSGYVEFTLGMLGNWSCSSVLIAHTRRLWNVERSGVWEGGSSRFTPCQGELHWLTNKK